MRWPTPPERRVLLLQKAAVCLFGPSGSITYLHTHDPALGTTPAAAAWIGGEVARRAGEALRCRAQQPAEDEERGEMAFPEPNAALLGRAAPGGGGPEASRGISPA
jgi:hypothetical protein